MQCLALVERQFAAATHWAAWETVRETSRHESQNPDADSDCGGEILADEVRV